MGDKSFGIKLASLNVNGLQSKLKLGILELFIQEYDVIGVKSGMHFRAFYENFTDKLLIADVPGTTSRDITLFEHTQLKYPIYPLNPNTTFNLKK